VQSITSLLSISILMRKSLSLRLAVFTTNVLTFILYSRLSSKNYHQVDWRRLANVQKTAGKWLQKEMGFQSLIHSFISGMHHYECVAPNVDISLQSGWFWATSIASFRERFIDFKSCWVVFIHVVAYGGVLVVSWQNKNR